MSWVRRGDKRRSLALKLALIYAVSFGLTAATGMAILYQLVRSHTLNEVDQELLTRKEEIALAIGHLGLENLGAEFAADTEAYGRQDYFIRLLGKDGKTKVSSDTSAWPAIPFSVADLAGVQEGMPQFSYMPLPDARSKARLLLARLGDGDYLQIGTSLGESENFLRNFEHDALIILASMISIGTLTGWWLARKAMGGVEAVTRTAAGIAGGDFTGRVQAAGYGREIDQLVSTFNRMADRVQILMEQMRQVNDNIAHDLRSPLTRIRGQAEAGVVHGLFKGEGAELVGSIVEDCDRLIQMINTMLDISETEAGVQGLSLSWVDPAELVTEVVETFRDVAEDMGIRLSTSLAHLQPLRCDRRRLQRALANLMDNALKYTPRGGEVHVELAERDGQVVIQFADTGQGIPKADQARLFERFYRADQSRHLPGSGLGLSLVRAIAHAHGGEIRVESEAGQGSRFMLVLPLPTRARRSDGAEIVDPLSRV